MAEAVRPNVYAMPAHRAFADALAAGLIRRFGKDSMGLARGIVLVPNNRASQALTNGFVRHAGGGLLLPRLIAIGDLDLDEKAGAALDTIGPDEVLPPVIDPMRRGFILARLIARLYENRGTRIDAAEALALAGDLGRTIDQLQVERVDPHRLSELEIAAELQDHWQQSLELFRVLAEQWPEELARIGALDLAEYRNRLLDRVAGRFAAGSAAPFVVAAGISTAAPAVASLMKAVAFMPQGMVVLADLDLAIPREEWDALGPHGVEDGVRAEPNLETHPQYHLKLLLDRMGIARDEVKRWPAASGADAPSRRSLMVSNAFAPAAFTGKWRDLASHERSLAGIDALAFANPAAEAQGIALAMREVLDTPGRTAALVTPDRALALRVSAHLARWGVAADDSAGRPLARTPAGALPLLIAEAAAAKFAPVELMSLMKHPLVMAGDRRLAWLEGARGLDRVLRGPRPATGLDGVTAMLRAEGDERTRDERRAVIGWWQGAVALLRPIESGFAEPALTIERAADIVRDGIDSLAGEAGWAGPAGRALAEVFTDIARFGGELGERLAPDSVAQALERLMDGIAVRPPQGGHPRLSIWGLIEARLQSADLMILGGLNEGVWPQLPQPDPWPAPGIRRRLGLPGLDTRIGLSAHDFASALAAPRVLVTRARRDAGAPTVASRFLLRLEAMADGLPVVTVERDYAALATALDRAARPVAAVRPAPNPPAELRPKAISVTQLDRLKADPFAFYAHKILGLSALHAIDADPTAAWRGSAVHDVLDLWFREDGLDPAQLRVRAEALMHAPAAHPIIRAMWQPRVMEAIDWIAARMTAEIAAGRTPIASEKEGKIDVAGIRLTGKADRIDRMADGSLAIVDYKTGKAPSAATINAGYQMQLGLLGLIAERGGFGFNPPTDVTRFEYWSLAKYRDQFGQVVEPFARKPQGDVVTPDSFVAAALASVSEAAARWLTGDEPFTAKLEPDFAPYADYDQLMRLQEWYGA